MRINKILFLIVLVGIVFCRNAFSSDFEPFIPIDQFNKIRPADDRYCFDFTDTLSEDVIREIDKQGESLQRNFDVDFVVTMIPSLEENDIVDYTVNLFSNWEIGKSTQGKKGILILIALEDQKVKIEIGYDLEAIYTDAYVGQVEREILVEFLEQAEWGIGFLATMESFLFRIFNKDLGDEITEISSPDNDMDYYSQGAGATNVFDFGAALKKPLPDNYNELKRYFSAQPTPDLAFQRYMELSTKAVKHNNDLTLFTELSNKFWKGWKHTFGQSKAEAQEISGRSYIIKQKENHAVVFFPAENAEQMKKSPVYYLFKSNEGWQVDINTMTRSLRVVGPGWMMLTDIFHAYTEIIIENYNRIDGFLAPWDTSKAYKHLFRNGSEWNERNKQFSIRVHWQHEETSNLKTGDRVLAINGTEMRDWNHLVSFFDNSLVGDSLVFEVVREGKKIVVKEKLTGQPDGYKKFRPCLKTPRRWLGVYMVQSLDKEWRHTLKLRDQGMFRYSSLCYILDIYPGSPADKAGLKVGDLILDYGMPDDNGEIMPYDVIKALYKTKPDASMELTILRDLKDKMKIVIKPEETLHEGYF